MILGTTAVEAGLRTCRAATGKHEFISCFMDFHGKSGHAISLARMTKFSGPTRAPGFYMVPRPDTYRPWWVRGDGTLDTEKYLEFYDTFIRESTTGQVAAFVLEPIQGWGGSIIPPDDFFPKLKKFLEERDILLFADEVLTSMGRTGKFLAMEHWDVVPDVVTLGKGFGNGFPVTAMAVRTPYADAVDKIRASTSYGGNPMACAAALACFEVIEEENLLEHALHLEKIFTEIMNGWKDKYKIVGDVRAKGCLLGVELVKDKATKEPFDEAGKLVYQKALAVLNFLADEILFFFRKLSINSKNIKIIYIAGGGQNIPAWVSTVKKKLQHKIKCVSASPTHGVALMIGVC